jgi:hypothetical protein
VKITPAHDPNDFNVGKRHSLEFINILDDDGNINDNGGQFCGQPRFKVRADYMPGHMHCCRQRAHLVQPPRHLKVYDAAFRMYVGHAWHARCSILSSLPAMLAKSQQ